MISVKRLLELGFTKKGIHEGFVYCVGNYCIKADVTGCIPTSIESNEPMAWTTALDTEVDLIRYFK